MMHRGLHGQLTGCNSLSNRFHHIIGAALVVLLAGCAGDAQATMQPHLTTAAIMSQPLPLPNERAGFNLGRPHVTSGYVFVSEYRCPCVKVYSAVGSHQPVLRTITRGLSDPQGIAVDSNANLYVADDEQSAQGRVVVYPPGANSPSEALVENGADPSDVCIGPDGTVYVADLWTQQGFGPGDVAIYAHGSTTPTGHLLNPSIVYTIVTSCWVDSANNVYVGFEGGNGAVPLIDVFPGASQTPKTLGIFIFGSYILKLFPDPQGNLLVADCIYQPCPSGIYEFAQGAVFPDRTVFRPNTRTNLYAYGMAFDSTRTDLYVATGPAIKVLDYSTGTVVNTISAGIDRSSHLGNSIAVSPPAP